MISNRMHTEPVPVVRQHRPVNVKAITSGVPGRIMPVAAFGLLRGDSCSGRVRIGVSMAETHEVLFNRMSARLSAWFVPKVAMERFQRNKTFFDRSARGEATTDVEGAPVIDFIETMVMPEPGTHAVFQYLGLPYPEGAVISDEYQEAYNQIVAYVYRNLSKSLAAPLLSNTALQPAVWGRSVFSEIVPDFDAGLIAGELPLSITNAKLPVSGIGISPAASAPAGAIGGKYTGGLQPTPADGWVAVDETTVRILEDPDHPGYPGIFANFSNDGGVSVSLANIDQARQLVDWAKVRERYEGHPDPWVIDTLMSGLGIDEQKWFHPMLLDQQMVEFQQVPRMSTSSGALEEGVANGMATGSLGINIPANTFGGTVMVLAEFIPEQLYERQTDPYLSITDIDDLPQYDKDVLNPMPVVPVYNREVDASHSTPNGQFGWARRNWQFAATPTRIGGSMFAPTADSATEVERRPLYPTDVANPALGPEFYLSTTLGREVFLDEEVDPFKVVCTGQLDVMGLTVIGAVHESEANYDEVRAKYPPLPNEGA